MGDIATGFNYGMNAAAKPFDGKNKYIRITDIDESSSEYSYNDVVSPDGILQDSYLVRDDDILLARTGASTGKSYLYKTKDGCLYFAGFLIRINIPKDNPYFIFSQLHTIKYKKWIAIMSARSGQPGINSQEYSSYPLYLTNKKEQSKISILLSKLDERISTQNKIIDNLESLIKGIGEQITHSAHVSTMLNECLECHTSALQESDVNSQGSYPVYGANGIVGYSETYQAECDAILIIKDGSSVGSAYTVSGKFSVIGTLNYLTTKVNYSLHYIYFCLKIFNFHPYKTGMAIPHIYFKDYSNAKIYCPSFEIQCTLAKGLMNIESKIKIEREYLTSLIKQKTFLLQKMFI